MTDKELLQQWLDMCVLAKIQGSRAANTALLEEIISDIKARLAQPEPEHWSDCAVYNEPAYPKGLCNCGGFPVAWADLKGIRLEFDIEDCFSFIKKEDYVPLYTAPPKKEWVGLTDADWIIGKRSADYIAGAEWAEAKLKEKNS